MTPLPRIMVALNGARRTKTDHPKLPITIAEMVEEAVKCQQAGADGIHLHVRDENGKHVLDAGLYREALAELKVKAPALLPQITTEAVGVYNPEQQRSLVKDVKPEQVSIAISEMTSDQNFQQATEFYKWCEESGITVQHIIYGEEDLKLIESLLNQNHFKKSNLQLLFVLGKYTPGQQSTPQDLTPFTDWLGTANINADWSVCAFGSGETACLKEAAKNGGKVRVGFENSLWNADGSIAKDNAERVREVAKAISQL